MTVKEEVKVEAEQKPRNLDLLNGLLERRKNQEQKSEIKKEEKTEIDDILGKSVTAFNWEMQLPNIRNSVSF